MSTRMSPQQKLGKLLEASINEAVEQYRGWLKRASESYETLRQKSAMELEEAKEARVASEQAIMLDYSMKLAQVVNTGLLALKFDGVPAKAIAEMVAQAHSAIPLKTRQSVGVPADLPLAKDDIAPPAECSAQPDLCLEFDALPSLPEASTSPAVSA
ncbi:MAG: hypothetical protein WAZ94_10975 [Phycisphaerales bacterium]